MPLRPRRRSIKDRARVANDPLGDFLRILDSSSSIFFRDGVVCTDTMIIVDDDIAQPWKYTAFCRWLAGVAAAVGAVRVA